MTEQADKTIINKFVSVDYCKLKEEEASKIWLAMDEKVQDIHEIIYGNGKVGMRTDLELLKQSGELHTKILWWVLTLLILTLISSVGFFLQENANAKQVATIQNTK